MLAQRARSSQLTVQIEFSASHGVIRQFQREHCDCRHSSKQPERDRESGQQLKPKHGTTSWMSVVTFREETSFTREAISTTLSIARSQPTGNTRLVPTGPTRNRTSGLSARYGFGT
jgi:hypothetical protein